MGKASDWLREERRKTLGDWVAVCVACGHAQRYFEDYEAELPERCPQCTSEMRWRCPACGARFSSAFAVDCEACGEQLRPAEAFGTPIRRRIAGFARDPSESTGRADGVRGPRS